MRNYITDVKGIEVGHFTDDVAKTGVTVILAKEGARGGVDVRGGAPGTRETDLFKAENTVEKIHSIVLSGGSAYGLEASCGVMNYLEEIGVGQEVGPVKVPIVAGAVIFDLLYGDSKIRPDKAMGYKACQNASSVENQRGSVGAGTGATVGKLLGPQYAMKGGLGSASVIIGDLVVSALVIVNAVGDVYDNGLQIAGPNVDGVMQNTLEALINSNTKNLLNSNTTIGVIATNAKLTKAQCSKTAQVGHDGMARAIKPVHTAMDGDTLFVMSTGEIEAEADLVGQLAAEVVEKAIVDSIRNT